MAKPTPGPWEVDPSLPTIIWTRDAPYGHGRMRIADIRGWGHLTGRGACNLDEAPAVAIQEANARLIAAAPDLLAALGGCITALSFEGEQAAARGDEIALRQIHTARQAAYAAIARAEGRS